MEVNSWPEHRTSKLHQDNLRDPEENPKTLVERFNQWADERILDYEDMPTEYIEKWRIVQRARIETLQFAKINLERLAKEEDHADS